MRDECCWTATWRDIPLGTNPVSRSIPFLSNHILYDASFTSFMCLKYTQPPHPVLINYPPQNPHLKVNSYQAKAKANVNISFDDCRLFCDLFRLFLDPLDKCDSIQIKALIQYFKTKVIRSPNNPTRIKSISIKIKSSFSRYRCFLVMSMS